MNCTTCGTALVAGALFCPNCGSRAPAPSSAGAPTMGLAPTYGEPAPPLSQPYDSAPPVAPPIVAPPLVAPQWVAPGSAPYGVTDPPNSTAAVVSLVFGILTWIFLPVIGPIVAVVAGHMARAEIRRSNGQLGGSGMAMAGLVLGYLQIALFVLAICAIVAIGFLTLLGSRVSAP
jgi:hypothetical protein